MHRCSGVVSCLPVSEVPLPVVDLPIRISASGSIEQHLLAVVGNQRSPGEGGCWWGVDNNLLRFRFVFRSVIIGNRHRHRVDARFRILVGGLLPGRGLPVSQVP